MAARFAFVRKTDPDIDRMSQAAQTAKDVASTAGGVAKTFVRGSAGSNSPSDVDYGPGPAPASQTPPVTDAWYKSYGRYAPKK